MFIFFFLLIIKINLYFHLARPDPESSKLLPVVLNETYTTSVPDEEYISLTTTSTPSPKTTDFTELIGKCN